VAWPKDSQREKIRGMTQQLDLISPAWPNGFDYFRDFISKEEEEFLLSFAKTLPWGNYEMHGVPSLRKIYRFGVNYGLEAEKDPRPIPKELAFIISRGAQALKVNPKEVVQLLFTFYPPGAPIGWHRDAPMYEKLLGISMAGSCTMKLKPYDPKSSPVKVELAPRSAYCMTGESRWNWEHHIPPVKEERFSLTMRTLKAPVSTFSQY
jgi:alkylated DNA repair protein (DNA oxidative demethylase)